MKSFWFVFRYVTKNLINMDQRNDFTQKVLRQILILPPCSLRRCVVPRVLLRLRFGGTDVATVAGILGHSQPSTTLDIYTHAFDKNKKAASAELQGMLEI